MAEEVLSSCFDHGMEEAEEILAVVDEFTMAHPDSESPWCEFGTQQIDQRIHKLKAVLAEREKVGQPEQNREET